jgi:hypothetical protein
MWLTTIEKYGYLCLRRLRPILCCRGMMIFYIIFVGIIEQISIIEDNIFIITTITKIKALGHLFKLD